VFCERKGGAAKGLADYCIIAAGTATSTIQEVHTVLTHTLCECVEAAMFAA
jgi:D-sedoheptulose 7-phosphate isomerase